MIKNLVVATNLLDNNYANVLFNFNYKIFILQ